MQEAYWEDILAPVCFCQPMTPFAALQLETEGPDGNTHGAHVTLTLLASLLGADDLSGLQELGIILNK